MEKAKNREKTPRVRKRPYEKPRVKVIAVETYDVLGTCNHSDDGGPCIPTQL